MVCTSDRPPPPMPNLRARQMRNHPTEAESLLWQHLRRSQLLGRKFRRQEPIEPYIVDFICFDPMLAIEIDGSQHTECMAYDSERSAFLERRGFKVIRFWNHEVLAQTDRVREAIRQCVAELIGSPTP
jgi:very-short-patch-repair endonuclease